MIDKEIYIYICLKRPLECVKEGVKQSLKGSRKDSEVMQGS